METSEPMMVEIVGSDRDNDSRHGDYDHPGAGDMDVDDVVVRDDSKASGSVSSSDNIIDRMPDEVLLQILKHLPSTDVALPIQLVSHRFRHLGTEPQLWLEACRRDFKFWRKDQGALLYSGQSWTNVVIHMVSSDSESEMKAGKQAGKAKGKEIKKAKGKEIKKSEEDQEGDEIPGDEKKATEKDGKQRQIKADLWRNMWLRRMSMDRLTGDEFGAVVSRKMQRLFYLQRICEREYESKDYLWRQSNMSVYEPWTTEAGVKRVYDDVLARQFFSRKALQSIRRADALREWLEVRRSPRNQEILARAIGAFDMFMLHCDGIDSLGDIERMLDYLAARFRVAHSETLATMTLRVKALSLARWLRSEGYIGVANDIRLYQPLCASLLGLSLQRPEVGSLSTVATVIYTSVARRLGLQADCYLVPSGCCNGVLAPRGQTLDTPPSAVPKTGGRPVNYGIASMFSSDGRMEGEESLDDDIFRDRLLLLDSYRSDEELNPPPQRDFVLRLSAIALVGQMCRELEQMYENVRMANRREDSNLQQELRAVLQESNKKLRIRHGRAGGSGMVREDTPESLEMNLESLLYGVAWVQVLLQRPEGDGAVWLDCVRRLVVTVVKEYSEDMRLVQKYVCPEFDEFERRELRLIQEHQRVMKELMREARLIARQATRLAMAEAGGWAVGGLGEGLGGPSEGVAEGATEEEMEEEDFPIPPEIAARPIWTFTTAGRPGHEISTTWRNPQMLIQMMENLDRRRPDVQRRYTQEIQNLVPLRVGQVVRHMRYGYNAIISGWELRTVQDPEGRYVPPMAPEEDEEAGDVGLVGVAPGDNGNNGNNGDNGNNDNESIADNASDLDNENNVDTNVDVASANAGADTHAVRPRRERRRKAGFYHTLRAGGTEQVIDVLSVVPIVEPSLVSQDLKDAAGLYFKRFDAKTCTFVSNIKDFYPDD